MRELSSVCVHLFQARITCGHRKFPENKFIVGARNTNSTVAPNSSLAAVFYMITKHYESRPALVKINRRSQLNDEPSL